MAKGNDTKCVVLEELGKYCLDISKLVFGGVILAGVMNLGVDSGTLFSIGGIAVAFMAFCGFVFIALSKSK